ncbi:MAG TPA: hypothetical protein VMM79_20730 [Longimicrobiales bacterium]|nr:hypothetical protein [Longimicrobiales bacterium]
MSVGDRVAGSVFRPPAGHAVIRDAADSLFRNPEGVCAVQPTSTEEARVAVERFGELFMNAPGVFTAALRGARSSAGALSHDRLQGLAEIIQNADDAAALAVRFDYRSDALVIRHDGRPVDLRDVLALATPWLTTKRDEAVATGRWGIGLMTLQSLSPTLEVYSGPYAMRLGEPTISWVDPLPAAVSGRPDSETWFRLPVGSGRLTAEQLRTWLERWDDAALLFCSNVREVEVWSGGNRLHALGLDWSEAIEHEGSLAGHTATVRVREARARDGRRWSVHSTALPAPPGIRRIEKAQHALVPYGVALPWFDGERGAIHVGLPVLTSGIAARLHTQFDPTTGRQSLIDTDWNRALRPALASLWEHAVRSRFFSQPAAAWRLIPLPGELGRADHEVGRLDEDLLDRARSVLAGTVQIPVGQRGHPIISLAVESTALTAVISESEIARLAGLPATLPTEARDESGRWRLVLSDWRASGTALPPEVDVRRALALLGEPDRSVESVIALAAAALRSGLGSELLPLPAACLSDGSRMCRPGPDDPWLLVTGAARDRLGITRPLSALHTAETPDANLVLEWLREDGGLATEANPHTLVARLSRVGTNGRRLPTPLSDAQLVALRDMFTELPQAERAALGPGVGYAIRLRAYEHDSRGRRRETVIEPAAAYIPSQIDRDRQSLGVAAQATAGLTWLHGRYARVLRSPAGRTGLGALRFLRLLGAETAPRLVPHPDLIERYRGRRLGLSRDSPNSPVARGTALGDKGASYTLGDMHSPDMVAILRSIARERRAKRRRERASAILGVLGRAWTERLSDHAVVTAADDSYGWVRKGEVRALWLWEAGSIPWLDNARGTPSTPIRLIRRTPGTLAVRGSEYSAFLHSDLHDHRVEVLAGIGVAGDSDTGTLIARLQQLRDNPVADVRAVAATLYRTVAERLEDGTHLHGDLSATALLAEFNRAPGLLLTNLGWRRPSETFRGDPVFGDRRAFATAVSGCKPLWDGLRLKTPGLDDYLAVMTEMARVRRGPEGEDAAILLESLRFLAKQPNLEGRAERLAVWTTRGWRKGRPVYVVEDLPLADGLADQVPVWQPGGEVSQFKALFGPLRLTPVSSQAARVATSTEAWEDEVLTRTLRAAVQILREDLARNDPGASERIRTQWEGLQAQTVRIAPDLRVHVSGVGSKEGLSVPVAAWADMDAGVLYLRDAVDLSRPSGGGRAVASLFGSDPRRLAQAWLAACVEAEQGRQAAEIRLAAERRAEDERAIAQRLATLESEIQQSHARQGASGAASGPAGAETGTGKSAEPSGAGAGSERTLIDPGRYRVVNPGGDGSEAAPGTVGSPNEKGGAKLRNLPPPQAGGGSPVSHTPVAGYTALEREAVGLALLREVLASDDLAVRDLRAQRGLGADAVDRDGRYWELKVYAGAEPDQVSLEGSQLARAASTPDFWLVVVSRVERGQGRRACGSSRTRSYSSRRSSVRPSRWRGSRARRRWFVISTRCHDILPRYINDRRQRATGLQTDTTEGCSVHMQHSPFVSSPLIRECGRRRGS